MLSESRWSIEVDCGRDLNHLLAGGRQIVLRPGQYGRVRAVTSVREEALLVPQRAVTELQGTYQVAVVGADNKVSIRPIKLCEKSGSLWVVEEGLNAGESVVAEGTLKVRPGMTVSPKAFVTIR